MNSNQSKDKIRVIIISDGIGNTAREIADCTLAQFPHLKVSFSRFMHVNSKEQIMSIFNEASANNDIIIYTIVTPELRDIIKEISIVKDVFALDLLGPVLDGFAKFFNQTPTSMPGLYRALNEEYFKRVAAMEFTLNHDDGKNLSSLYHADAVIIGISRTSKTPLSIYLSQNYSLKVVNIPLVMNTRFPDEIYQIDQRKIFALNIDPHELRKIRIKRLGHLGAQNHTGDYADLSRILHEVEWANSIFKDNKRWPVFDVTNKAIEETAAEIMKLFNMRKTNIFK
ncbi:MAG: kinase/pyrophosphorylase [Bacteriovoracaceae bacterium]|nr:kinase/pyrophosphorylase [Bacteriovoracaceae bacterium]